MPYCNILSSESIYIVTEKEAWKIGLSGNIGNIWVVSLSKSVSCMPALEGLPHKTILTQPLLAMQYVVHIFLQGFLGRVRTWDVSKCKWLAATSWGHLDRVRAGLEQGWRDGARQTERKMFVWRQRQSRAEKDWKTYELARQVAANTDRLGGRRVGFRNYIEGSGQMWLDVDSRAGMRW